MNIIIKSIFGVYLVGLILALGYFFDFCSGIFFNDLHVALAIIPVRKYLDTVTQKAEILKENEGKSGIYLFTNKVNGKNYVGSATNLRKRLMEYFNPKYLDRKNYMSSTSPTLHPLFITGFADAESSFILLINKNSQYKTGYSLQASFSINLHKKDCALLENIASFYGVGNITKGSKDSISCYIS